MTGKLVYIYADESCLGNQQKGTPRPGAAAGLLEQYDERRGWVRRDFAHFEPDTTNNRMAILSAILPLGILRRPCDVVFTSDSQYLVRGMKEWVHGWIRRGWRRKGGAVENVALWQQLVKVSGRHRVEWRWVRGHAAYPKNEYANALAVRTAREGRGIEGLAESGFDEWLQGHIDRGVYVDFLDVPPGDPFLPDPPPGRA